MYSIGHFGCMSGHVGVFVRFLDFLMTPTMESPHHSTGKSPHERIDELISASASLNSVLTESALETLREAERAVWAVFPAAKKPLPFSSLSIHNPAPLSYLFISPSV